MFLSKISINSCMITQYVMEENIFVDSVYKLLQKQKHWNVRLKTVLKSMVNKALTYQKIR